MKQLAVAATVACACLSGCLGKISDVSPVPCQADAAIPFDQRIDSCVENVHTQFACAEENLPFEWSAIDCDGVPKKMHTQTGTLFVRDTGRDGCTAKTNYLGERLLCCPPAVEP
jgi:hypothetical protein